MSAEANHYNPARDEPAETRRFAKLCELLRRNPEFRTDAALWVEAFNECEALLAAWKKMSDGQRRGRRGKENERRRVELRRWMFAIKHASAPFLEWEPTPLAEPNQPLQIDAPTQEQLGAARAWPRLR
jgi:hypothetical protein